MRTIPPQQLLKGGLYIAVADDFAMTTLWLSRDKLWGKCNCRNKALDYPKACIFCISL